MRKTLSITVTAGLVLAASALSTGSVFAGNADGEVKCLGQKATIVGTQGNDLLLGTKGPDVIAGMGGNDRIFGLGGNDLICGGRGADLVVGNAGADKLLGNAGPDRMFGGIGPDKMFAGVGNDRVLGGFGNDDLDGQAGTDFCKQGRGTGKVENCELPKVVVPTPAPTPPAPKPEPVKLEPVLGALDVETGQPSVRFRSFGNTGGNEVYLGLHDLGTPANRVEKGYTWVKPGTYEIEFWYDKATNKLSTSWNGEQLDYTPSTGAFCDWDALQVLVLNRDSGTTVNLNDVEIDGLPAGDFTGGTSFPTGTWVIPYDFGDDFMVTAELELAGSFGSSQENSKAQLTVGCK